MYEYVIPQEFNQSDRLGPFTMPQAAILGAGGILIMFMLSTLSLWISLPLSIVIAVITAYFMYKKVNRIPMYEFIFVYGTYRSMPKLLIYRKENIKDEYIDDIDIFLIDDEEE